MVVGKTCPKVAQITTIKGDPVLQLPIPGQVTIIEFWATWCGPCRAVFPHISALQQKYKTRGLVVVGLSMEPDSPQLRDFVQRQGDKMQYTVACGEQASQSLASWANVGGIPFALVVDRQGTVVYAGHPAQGLDTAVEKAMALQPIVATQEELSAMSSSELKKILSTRGVGFADLLEKSEFVQRILERCT